MSTSNTEKTVRDIRRNTRREFSTEEKIRVVLDRLRGLEVGRLTLSIVMFLAAESALYRHREGR
jgi:hypothetical protein